MLGVKATMMVMTATMLPACTMRMGNWFFFSFIFDSPCPCFVDEEIATENEDCVKGSNLIFH